ncbi:CYTH domain-containing protein [Phormidium yuhuli AB48]|uniref:CYTH domain-containing protein n=1 Tax=Phormidium yuhuli AB48 TaxID=2940671 RepID=A0ABY5AMV5_9CYAN|nr:CYTH domain-containing protein [Phormidium yuhuli]USR90335.1 CYTH domain-containing protein [Phormidium yuhuli AB48]
MAQEIERKFLVKDDSWRSNPGVLYRQGYLTRQRDLAIRVRIGGDRAWLTLKGATVGVSRLEYEYSIPLGEAQEMLDHLCETPIIEKRRYRVMYEGLTWEIDEFLGENQGLIVAEVELEREEQRFTPPPWLGREVSDDPRYYNANLVKCPYSQWEESRG